MVAWVAFALASFVLIGALSAAWERIRGARPEPVGRARLGAVVLYFANQGILVPLIGAGLSWLGLLVHPERLGSSWRAHELAVGFLCFEAVTYALHRLSHRIPWLVRLHRIHHASKDIDWLDAFRQHPVEFFLFQTLGNLPAVLLFGTAGQFSLWVNVGLRFLTAWLHARGELSLGPLEYVLTSPEMHHRHHGKCGREERRRPRRARNYGGVLSVFDWLGGTVSR